MKFIFLSLLISNSVFASDYIEAVKGEKIYETPSGEYRISYVVVPNSKKVKASIIQAPVKLELGLEKNVIFEDELAGEELAYCQRMVKKEKLEEVVNNLNKRPSMAPNFPSQNPQDFKNRFLRDSYIVMDENNETIKNQFLSEMNEFEVEFVEASLAVNLIYDKDSRYQAIENYFRFDEAKLDMQLFLNKNVKVFSLSQQEPAKIMIKYKYLWCDILEGKASLQLDSNAYFAAEIVSNTNIAQDQNRLTQIVKELMASPPTAGQSESENNFILGMEVSKTMKKYDYAVKPSLIKKYGNRVYFEMFTRIYDLRDEITPVFNDAESAVKKMIFKDDVWENTSHQFEK